MITYNVCDRIHIVSKRCPVFGCTLRRAGLWSVTFIEVWKRREAEHRFLWGADRRGRARR